MPSNGLRFICRADSHTKDQTVGKVQRCVNLPVMVIYPHIFLTETNWQSAPTSTTQNS